MPYAIGTDRGKRMGLAHSGFSFRPCLPACTDRSAHDDVTFTWLTWFAWLDVGHGVESSRECSRTPMVSLGRPKADSRDPKTSITLG